LGYDGGLTISFQVKDRKKTAKWWEDVMGLKLEYDAAEIGWCELRTECQKGFVGLSQGESPQAGAGAVPGFGVRDLDSARARLEKHGIRFDGDTRTIPGMVKLATFFEPNGHALMLYELLSQARPSA